MVPTTEGSRERMWEGTWSVPSDQYMAAVVTVTFIMTAEEESLGKEARGLHTCEIFLTSFLPSSKKASG